MPTARESLLDAALAALSGRPWPGVRMVDVAVAARVSRQTLYNEFGSKDGLARALVRREVDRYLAGVRHALAGPPPGEPGERLAAVADWTARTARHNPLVRAALTGCWGSACPARPVRPPGRTPGRTSPRSGARTARCPRRPNWWRRSGIWRRRRWRRAGRRRRSSGWPGSARSPCGWRCPAWWPRSASRRPAGWSGGPCARVAVSEADVSGAAGAVVPRPG